MSADAKEAAFQQDIIDQMLEGGWKLGDPELYREPDRQRALLAERSELEAAVATLYREWEALASELEEAAGD